MPWLTNHYDVDEDGDFSREEAERAAENGDLQRLTNGNYYDKETGIEYWYDGTKKG